MENRSYEPLSLDFPFGRWFATNLVKRDFDLIGILGEISSDIVQRYPYNKLSMVCRKLAEISKMILFPGPNMRDKALESTEIMKIIFELIDDLYLKFPENENDRNIIELWRYKTVIDSNKILNHFYDFSLRLKVRIFEINGDAEQEYFWELTRLKYNLEHNLMPKVSAAHFIINYTMILMQNKWKRFKMFKQYHSCLISCQIILDAIPTSEENLISIQRYLHYAWAFYAGRLLDYSNMILHRKTPHIIDDRCITFDASVVVGPPPRFVMPDKPLTSKDNLSNLMVNLDILEKNLLYWGNFTICGTMSALDILHTVKKYAHTIKF